MTKQALGRGLSALIPEIQGSEVTIIKTNDINEIDIDKIVPGKYQPRKNFNDIAQNELIASIKEKGVIQPIIVRQKDDSYELIAGERRFRAAKNLTMAKIPAIIKNISDVEALELSLIENIQRENLDPIEEANAYDKLIKEFNLTQENVSGKVGKDRSTITNSLRLLNLPLDIQEKVSKGEISVGHAKVLLSIDSSTEQRKVLEKIIKDGLSVRDTEKSVSDLNKTPVHKKKMAYKDPQIIAYEEDIQRILGTKVQICQGKDKGKIEIEYYNQEELGRILEFFGVSQNK